MSLNSMEVNQATATATDPFFLYYAAILAGLGGLLFGFDTGAISSIMIILREKFTLNSIWQEMIVSLTTLCAAIASLLGGCLNHFIGRKPVILRELLGRLGGKQACGGSGEVARERSHENANALLVKG